MSKEQILEVLESRKGEIISGLELAGRLGVTRSAIWKEINALRAEGYDIRAVKKTGYRLEENSDILSAFKILSALELDGEQAQLHVQKQVDSTNQRILCLAIEGAPAWTICAAEEQTAGRGHAMRVFRSPRGKGAYCSLLLRPCKGVGERELVMLAAVSACEAFHRYAGIATAIGGADDILCDGKKLCGILCEALSECESGAVSFAALGFGVNVYMDPEEPECDERFETSLFGCTGRYCNRSELIGALVNALYQGYGALLQPGGGKALEERYRALQQPC